MFARSIEWNGKRNGTNKMRRLRRWLATINFHHYCGSEFRYCCMKKLKKINNFMKKFPIAIGQWQKYGWKWEIAIGLCISNAIEGVAYSMYAKHIRNSRATEIALNEWMDGKSHAVWYFLPFHTVSLSFSFRLCSTRCPNHTPYVRRLYTTFALSSISLDWGAITKGYASNKHRDFFSSLCNV